MNPDKLLALKLVMHFLMVDFNDGFKYLGFFLKPSGYIVKDWRWLIKKIVWKFKSWVGRYLSLGGRLVLIKAVL